METKHGDTIFVHRIRINFTIVVFSCDRFATARHSKGGSVEITIIIFQGCTITAASFYTITSWESCIGILHSGTKSVSRHAHSSPILYMISSWEIKLLVLKPPGRVDVHAANAVFVIALASYQIRKHATHIGTGRVVQIFSNDTT